MTIIGTSEPHTGSEIKNTESALTDSTSNAQKVVGKNYELENYLSKHYDFLYNEITCRVEFRKKEEKEYKKLTEIELNTIKRKLLNANIPFDQTRLQLTLNSDFSKIYNPFLDYMNSLPEYSTNSEDYIAQLANTVKTDNQELFERVLKKWLVALVGSLIDDEVINHCVLIMTGEQGVGKTTWQNNLIPKQLRNYIYTGAINPNDKDSNLQISENILINLDELGVLKGNRLNALKELITKKFIKVRRAYGYQAENYTRRASFCGSANEKMFLTDTTGNRRFLCFNVTDIDIHHEVNMDMVFAQALHLFKNGFKFYFDKADIEEINAYAENFRILSMEEEALIAYYKPSKIEDATALMTSTEIHAKIAKSSGLPNSNASIQRLGKALTKNAFERKKVGGSQKWAVESII